MREVQRPERTFASTMGLRLVLGREAAPHCADLGVSAGEAQAKRRMPTQLPTAGLGWAPFSAVPFLWPPRQGRQHWREDGS